MHDLIVIGGGAAGLAAAAEGVRRGASVLLVERHRPGGDCTFTGCVPSKTLLAAAAQGARYADARERVHATVARIAATEDESALRSHGIDVAIGEAVLEGAGAVRIDGRLVTARHVVIAAGAGPAVPPIDGLDAVPPGRVLTSDAVFDEPDRPDRLAVLGGGSVGCELAQAFAGFGSRVTIVEATDRLLSNEEPDASAVVRTVFERRGIEVRTASTAESVDTSGPALRLGLTGDGADLEVDRLLVAVGRRPATASLGLAEAGVALDEQGWVRVDDTLATGLPGVWAAGDVTGGLQLTHVADEMGRLAAANALGRRPRRLRLDAVPWVTFTNPEVARVGMTEAQAADRGGRVAVVPLDEVDRALTDDAADGFVKLIAGPRRGLGNIGGGRVLGATIVAPHAGELISEVALVMRTGMFAGRVAQTVHPYPTYAVALRMAAAQLFGEVRGRAARPARPAP